MAKHNVEQEILRDNYCGVIQHVNVTAVLPYLFQHRVISLDEKERIEHKVTSQDKAKE